MAVGLGSDQDKSLVSKGKDVILYVEMRLRIKIGGHLLAERTL
jgi:hypothetical protein